ncbi:MAG: hypothetical protein ACI4P4_15825 [Faecousia sp.]
MLKFYTPNEWYSLFQCPSLIIDDEGRIWKADDYYKIISGAPVGRVDYTRGCIYGEDLGYGLLASAPIAYLETKNGVTQVLDGKKGLFSAPILYIKDDKVYTPERYTALFDAPSGYIKEEAKEEKEEEEAVGVSSFFGKSEDSDGGGSPGCLPGCLGGELGIFAFFVVFLLVGNMLDSVLKTPGHLALFIVAGVELIILSRMRGFRDVWNLPWKYAKGGKRPEFISLCLKNAAIWGGIACLPLMIPGIIMMNHRSSNWLSVIPVVAVVFSMYLGGISRLMLGDYIPLWPCKENARETGSESSGRQPPEAKKAESAPGKVPAPVPTEAPTPKPEPPASRPTPNPPAPKPESLRQQEPPVSGEPGGSACALLARKVAEDWVPGGKMYSVIADPNLKINGMRLTVSNYVIRICLESDGSSARLSEILPESLWQKEYSLASFPGFSAPVTDSQRFEIHAAVRDELAKRPYYIVSQDSRTRLVRDPKTGMPCFLSTGFDIRLEKKYKVARVSRKV